MAWSITDPHSGGRAHGPLEGEWRHPWSPCQGSGTLRTTAHRLASRATHQSHVVPSLSSSTVGGLGTILHSFSFSIFCFWLHHARTFSLTRDYNPWLQQGKRKSPNHGLPGKFLFQQVYTHCPQG